MQILSIQEVNKTYYSARPLHVLKGISMDIEEGELVSIMGSSGSGKSTLLNIIGLLDTYDTGKYILNGRLMQNLSENDAAEIRNHTIGFIFQSFNLIAYKTAMENVALPLFYQGIPRKKRNLMAMESLERFGLSEWATHFPNELSGGQKQRLAIARALISKPKLILADEPTGALDSQTSAEVIRILQEVNESGITMIIVTHELGIAHRTRKIIHLKDGRIESIENNDPTLFSSDLIK